MSVNGYFKKFSVSNGASILAYVRSLDNFFYYY